MNETLNIGFSSCPNDTFIFEALINRRITTYGFNFNHYIADVEQLNQMAMTTQLDITKLSFHAYLYVSEHYQILTSGAALGHKNGPVIVSKSKIYPDELKYARIAVPGQFTTACLLLYIASSSKPTVLPYLFSDIPDVVLSGETEAGILIHETRFTYQNKGLKKVIDLGEFWENKTGLPLPLGCIAVRRNIDHDSKTTINQVVKNSLEFAINNPEIPSAFISKYAYEKDKKVISQHISTFVNQYSVDLKQTGKDAIIRLFNEAKPYISDAEILNPVFVA